MVVEASKMPGDGKLVLTGQLGSVMKESATIALNWIRSHARQVDLGQDYKNDFLYAVKLQNRLTSYFIINFTR